MKDRRKTLFMIMCYLLVCVMIVANFSLARYKKEIEADVLMPAASNFRGSMALDETLAYETTMTELMPGVTAQLKEENELPPSLKFTVMNYETEDGTTKTVSETPLNYNIRVYGERHIPLSLVLCHGDQAYPATCKKSNDGYVYTFETKAAGATEADEVVFDMTGVTEETDEFTVYVGWAEEDEWTRLDKNVKTAIPVYDSHHYEKEVEHLEFRAIVRGAYIGTDTPESAPEAQPGLLFAKE